MSFLDLLKIEFMKVKRSKIVPLIFIAPLLVVVSGVANLSNYFTPEYTNAWPAMFIQSALVYAYYLLPFSMIVVCVMIAGRETGNNGILKMLALPVSRCALSIAKFCVLTFYLFMEMVVFLIVQDDGIGLSEEKLQELKEKPHYLESTDERLDLRHGLGLVLVRQIVAAHEGTMTIDSKINCGCKIILTFDSTDTIPKAHLS